MSKQPPQAALLPPIIRPAATPQPCEIPLYLHRVRAGFPSPASDYLENGLDLNEYLLRNKAASFFFTVEGDSMRNAGILHGDKVLVDRAIYPEHNHIVVAVINGEFTLKRLFIHGGLVQLRPENPAFKPIPINDNDEVTIWGVALGVVRKLKA